MKKLSLLFVMMIIALTANAQFEKGKMYANASLSGLDMNYNGKNKFNFGVEGKVGYLMADNLMVTASTAYKHNGSKSVSDYVEAGVGGRYYIVQNGIYLGANCKYIHAYHDYNDVMPGIEVGYAFFISRTATIEPAIYYDQSFKKHSDYSTIGFRIGFGLYI
ncbi:MAG: outer membrane beta-barrel protein [Prevotella sp.]|nr:outer membrane beta-barrel protein [Prevotella sp.]